MSKFELLRYVRKWQWLILLLMAAGILLVYRYAMDNQSYTATAYIKYTNEAAAFGLTPNGKALDVEEIKCSSVIADAISDLGLRSSVESIRNKLNISPVIPDETQALIAYSLDNGTEYEYFPLEYRISYTCGSGYSTGYALRMLDSVISNYFEYYSANYIASVAMPNNAGNVSTDTYDYLECVQMLNGVANEMTDFLRVKMDESWSYRSSATGYSFEDLSEIYSYYQEYTIPGLYAYILDNGVTSDLNALRDKYQNNVTRNQLRMDNLSVSIERLQALLEQFSDKSKQGMDYTNGEREQGGSVLGNVYDWNGEEADTQTTYDGLVLEYADQRVEYEELTVDLAVARYIIDAFSGVTASTAADSARAVYLSESIAKLAADMNGLYTMLWNTVQDYNAYRSARNISMLTNISVQSGINVKLYMLIALVLFGLIGFFTAVVLGRVGDMLEYYIYIDKRVGIYNRAKCDLVIDEYRRKLLDEKFCCMAINIKNLASVNAQIGRAQCDAMQKTFAGLLSDNIQRSIGFAGYNGNGQFIVLMKDSSSARARELFEFALRGYKTAVEEASGAEVANAFDFRVGLSCSSEDNIYQIRDLLRTAVTRANA